MTDHPASYTDPRPTMPEPVSNPMVVLYGDQAAQSVLNRDALYQTLVARHSRTGARGPAARGSGNGHGKAHQGRPGIGYTP